MRKRILAAILVPVCVAAVFCFGAFTQGCSPAGESVSVLSDNGNPDASLSPRSSTGSFSGSLNGNEYLNYSMVLQGDYRYWRILVNNTGDYDIQVDTSNGSIYTVSAHTSGYIYSTNKWGAGTYSIGFSSKSTGQAMKGSVTCTLYTSLDEATP